MAILDAAPPVTSAAAVEVTGLTKRYGERAVVDGVGLRLRRGTVTGFVGPNGAGKTTTIRMLLGLVTPTAGSGTVLDAPLDRPDRYLERVGAMIEGPAFTPGLSARRNLRVLARLAGIGDARVDAVLATVGLAEREDDAVRTYSLGMRQRLGIAAALLPEPELLILDEPTNGLDPAGIRDVRALLRELADGGMTLLVSSHLLAEIEAICDDLVVLRAGRLVFSGRIGELLDAQRHTLVVRPEHEGERRVLEQAVRSLGLELVATPGEELVILAGADQAAAVNVAAFGAGVVLSSLVAHQPTLEETFLTMTKEVTR